MIEIIHTNSYVQASIHDNVIASLDASVKPSNVVQLDAVVNKTPDSKLPRVTNNTDASPACISGVTPASIDDMLTPVRRMSLSSSSSVSRPKMRSKHIGYNIRRHGAKTRVIVTLGPYALGIAYLRSYLSLS